MHQNVLDSNYFLLIKSCNSDPHYNQMCNDYLFQHKNIPLLNGTNQHVANLSLLSTTTMGKMILNGIEIMDFLMMIIMVLILNYHQTECLDLSIVISNKNKKVLFSNYKTF